MMRFVLLQLALLTAAVAAFGPASMGRFGVTKVSTSQVFSSVPIDHSLEGKYFQIEEMEDKESCTTELILNPDLSVTVLETNGPAYISASGSWKKNAEDGMFTLELLRKYEAGHNSKMSSDVGEFVYSTIRVFKGQMSKIGDRVGVEGAILDGMNQEKKVGFFEMIDTTVGEEGEESLKLKER